MEKKYAGMPVDAVVAIGLPSLDFAEKHSARLWPQARIVFTGVAVEVLGGRRLGPSTTGFPGGTTSPEWPISRCACGLRRAASSSSRDRGSSTA